MLSVIRCIGPVVCFLSFQEERIRTGCSRGSQLRRPFVGTSWHRHKRVISNWHGRRDRQGFVEREHRGSRNSCSERSSLRGRVRTRRMGQGKCGPSKRTLLVFGFGERWCHCWLYTKQRPRHLSPATVKKNCLGVRSSGLLQKPTILENVSAKISTRQRFPYKRAWHCRCTGGRI
jgi:hypothetical protein